MAKSLNLSGVFPPIITPFKSDESISWDKLEHNMKLWNTLGFRGYVVMGSNGEAAYLTTAEKVAITKKVKQLANADHLIVAGSGVESTQATIDLTQQLADAGADCALVLTPCFYKASMNAAALKAHYTKVCDASPIPVLLYSVPGNTGIDLPAEVAIELAAHNNCIGIKDSGGDIAKLTRMVAETRQHDFQVLCGSAGFFLPGLQMGSVGCVAASANCLGAQVVQLQKEYEQNGVTPKALDLQARLVAPNAAVTRVFGVPGLKFAMKQLGYEPGYLRSPLQPLNDQEQAKVMQAFQKSKFI